MTYRVGVVALLVHDDGLVGSDGSGTVVVPVGKSVRFACLVEPLAGCCRHDYDGCKGQESEKLEGHVDSMLYVPLLQIFFVLVARYRIFLYPVCGGPACICIENVRLLTAGSELCGIITFKGSVASWSVSVVNFFLSYMYVCVEHLLA